MSIYTQLILVLLSALASLPLVHCYTCPWNAHTGGCVDVDSNGYSSICNGVNGFVIPDVCEETYGVYFADVQRLTIPNW